LLTRIPGGAALMCFGAANEASHDVIARVDQAGEPNSCRLTTSHSSHPCARAAAQAAHTPQGRSRTSGGSDPLAGSDEPVDEGASCGRLVTGARRADEDGHAAPGTATASSRGVDGSLWKTPSFITACTLDGSWKIVMSAKGSPSTRMRSARYPGCTLQSSSGICMISPPRAVAERM